jgi:hypothetical protein
MRGHGVIQIHADRIVHIHGPRDAKEHLSEIGEDTPVVSFCGDTENAAPELVVGEWVLV